MNNKASQLSDNSDFYISEYKILNKVGEGANGAVYIVEKNAETFALKVLSNNEAHSHAIRDFRREAATLVRLKGDGVVSIVELNQEDDLHYMVMEFVEGETLADHLKKKSLNYQQLVQLSRDFAQLLMGVHKKGFIHGDLKPDNVILQKDGSLKLIDMGLAVDANNQGDKKVFGSIMYAPPEQLGVINSVIDARSDLFSLGVILYQAATAKLPIDERDVNSHLLALSKFVPPQLHDLRSDVKPSFSELIRSLLFLDPDDRMSSASLFIKNLDRLEEINIKLSEGLSFQEILGGGKKARFEFLAPMVGRKDELDRLMSAWENANSSSGSVSMIRAESGMGKSRLVKEFLKQVYYSDSPLFETKCDDDKQISFYAIRNILNSLLQCEKLQSGTLREALIQLLSDKKHGFSQLIGIAPAIKNFIDVSAEDENEISKDQIIISAGNFIIELSQLLNMLTIYIDDVQWIDEDSLAVVRSVSESIKNQSLMMVFTSRSELVYQDKVSQVIDYIHMGLAEDIQLSPLTDTEIKDLIDSQLGDFTVDAELYSVISEKSSYNPFVSLHYLNLLIDDGFLRPEKGHWNATVDDLSSLQLPSSIAELMLGKLSEFEAEELKVLSYAALLGSEFEISMLSNIIKDEKFLYKCINLAKHEGMINQVSQEVYTFSHDKVRESLLGKIEESELPIMNQRCAEALLGTGSLSFSKQCMLANFYMHGDQSDIERMKRECQKAGILAFKEFSYNDCLLYLSHVRQLCEAEGVEADLQVDMSLAGSYEELGQSNPAIELYTKLLNRTTEIYDKVLIRQKLATVYVAEFKINASYKQLCVAFKEINVGFPQKNNPFTLITSLAYFIFALVLSLFGYKFKIKNKTQRKKLNATIELYRLSTFVMFFVDMDLMVHSLLRFFFYAFKDRSKRNQSVSYISIALVFAIVGANKLSNIFKNKGLRIAEEDGNPENIAMVQCYVLQILYFTGKIEEAEEVFKNYESLLAQWLSPQDILGLYSTRLITSVLCGDVNKSNEEYQRLLKRFRGAEGTTLYRLQIQNSYAPLIEAMHGNVSKLKEMTPQIEADYKEFNDITLILSVIISRFFSSYLSKEWDPEIYNVIAEFENHKAFNPKMCAYGWKPYYILKAHLLHMRLTSMDVKDEKLLSEFDTALKQLKDTSAAPYLSIHRGHYHTLQGAYYRFVGQVDNAAKEFAKAETLTQKDNNYWAMIILFEEKAQLYEKGSNSYNLYMQSAQTIANKYDLEFITSIEGKRVGASSISSHNSLAQSSMNTTFQGESGSSSITQLKNTSYLKSLLQVSLSAISVVEPEEIAKLVLKEIVTVIGAERAIIFLQEDQRADLQPVATFGQEEGGDIKYSSTVVKRVLSNGETIIVGCSEDGELIGSESIVAQGIRSVICAPLKVHDDIYGAVYLDSRIVKGVFGAEDIEILQALANQVAISIVTAKTAQVEIEKIEFEKDMDLLSTVQQMLLPEKSSHNVNGVQFLAYYQPAQSCGGDWWTYTPISENEFSIMLGDVSGHGAASAMVTSIVSSTFLCLTKMNPELSLMEKLKLTSEQLLEISGKRYLMTMCTLEIDTEKKSLKTIGAGSPQIICLKNNGEISILDTLGTPLGLDTFEATENELLFEKGDRLFFFTDGIVEHKLPNGREVGFKKLYKMFENSKESPIEDVFKLFSDFIIDACGKTPQDDDISFLLVEF